MKKNALELNKSPLVEISYIAMTDIFIQREKYMNINKKYIFPFLVISNNTNDLENEFGYSLCEDDEPISSFADFSYFEGKRYAFYMDKEACKGKVFFIDFDINSSDYVMNIHTE